MKFYNKQKLYNRLLSISKPIDESPLWYKILFLFTWPIDIIEYYQIKKSLRKYYTFRTWPMREWELDTFKIPKEIIESDKSKKLYENFKSKVIVTGISKACCQNTVTGAGMLYDIWQEHLISELLKENE